MTEGGSAGVGPVLCAHTNTQQGGPPGAGGMWCAGASIGGMECTSAEPGWAGWGQHASSCSAEASANVRSLLLPWPQAERSAHRSTIESAARAQADSSAAAQRLAEVEGEMQQLLVAVERQKAASASKMKQLASMLQEL